MKNLVLTLIFALYGFSVTYGQKLYPAQEEGTGRYGKYGYKDSKGNLVIPYKYSGAGFFEEDGLAPVSLNNQSGYIDKSGREVIPLIYEGAGGCKDGMAAVKQKGKWGYIDTKGKKDIPFVYDDVQEFHEGLAAVKRKDKWGYIDKSGKQVISFVYDYAGYFEQGLAPVKPKGVKEEGFINPKGEMVIPVQFKATTGFNPDGTARVLKSGGDEWYSIDKTGKAVNKNEQTTAVAATKTEQCISGDCNNGTGLYKDSRYVYEGQFKNGMPHGKGRLMIVNGDMYEGDFEYGIYNGTGTLYSGDNSIYKGSFHQGVKQGKGTITYADGKQYEGMFRNGKPQNEKASTNDLPFYTGLFYFSLPFSEAVFARFDLENNLAITKGIANNFEAFDLNTGSRVVQNQNTIYTTTFRPETYAESFSATDQKQHAALTFSPPLQKNDIALYVTFGARDVPGTNYYIINAAIKCAGKGKSAAPRYKIRCYKLYTDGKVEKLSNNPVDFPYESKVPAVSEDGSRIAAYNSSSREYRIYSNYLKQSVILDAIPSDMQPTVFSNDKMWFSAKNDTLYHLSKAMLLCVYNAATGKLVRSRQYSNNRISEGRVEFAALIGNQLKCVVISDKFDLTWWKSQQNNTIETTPYNRKAFVLNLDDPDYLLPLVHPLFKKENYAAASANINEEYSKRNEQLAAEARRREEAARAKYVARDQQRGLRGIMDEEEDDYRPVNTVGKRKRYLSQQDMDNIIKSNSSSTSSGESGWDKYFREREKEISRDYKIKNGTYRGY